MFVNSLSVLDFKDFSCQFPYTTFVRYPYLFGESENLITIISTLVRTVLSIEMTYSYNHVV